MEYLAVFYGAIPLPNCMGARVCQSLQEVADACSVLVRGQLVEIFRWDGQMTSAISDEELAEYDRHMFDLKGRL